MMKKAVSPLLRVILWVFCFAVAATLRGEEAVFDLAELTSRGIETAESPIRFDYGGATLRTIPDDRIAASDFRRTVMKEETVEGDFFPREPVTTTAVDRTDQATGLKITWETTTYADFPEVVEWVAWLENTSDKLTPNLRHLLAADVTLMTGGSPALWHGTGESGNPAVNYSYQTDPLEVEKPLAFAPSEAYPCFNAFPYFRIEGKEKSFIVALGWTGQWSASFTATSDGNVRLTAGQETVDLYLKPGEKIRTPRITLFTHSPQTDAVNLWRRWFRTYILPREDGKVIAPKLILDAHFGGELYKDITEEQQIGAIRKARTLGIPCDGLWIDAGWYLRKNSPKTPIGYWFRTGDWTPDPERFPRGMKPLADELGPDAKLTLWYEPERIHRDATTLADYQKYVVPDLELIESYRMNMASPETVAFLSDLIGRSIRDNGVKIYRQDSNGIGPLAFIEQLEKIDPNFSDRKGMAENLYVQGYLTFWANLKKMNPGLIIDSCASGGRRNDLDTLRMGAVPLHYSDVGYQKFIEKQRYHDMLDQWFLYYKNIDAFNWDHERQVYDFYQSTVDLAPFMTYQPSLLLDHDTPENRHYVDRFLAVRDVLVSGDYDLLVGGFRPDSWTVAQYHDARRNLGALRVIRNEENQEETITVRLKKLNPAKRYRVTNLDTGEVMTASGRTLLDEGLVISGAPRSGQLIRYEESFDPVTRTNDGVTVDQNFLVLLSDLHVCGTSELPEKYQANAPRLEAICDKIIAMNPRPAAVLIFGDLAAKRGTVADYVKVKSILSRLDHAGIPWIPMLGNHDIREPFDEVFPEWGAQTEVPGRLVTEYRTDRADFLLLDILDGTSSGDTGLGAGQAKWLTERLERARRSRKPTFVCSHYPVTLMKMSGLLADNADAITACVAGHWHSWGNSTLPEEEADYNGTPINPAMPKIAMIGLPSCGYGGSVGFTALYLARSGAAFTFTATDPSDPNHGRTVLIPTPLPAPVGTD